MEESFFVQQINLLAEANGCKIVGDIDFDKKIINLEGSVKDELQCSMAISNFMNSCEDVVQDKTQGDPVFLTQNIGWIV